MRPKFGTGNGTWEPRLENAASVILDAAQPRSGRRGRIAEGEHRRSRCPDGVNARMA